MTIGQQPRRKRLVLPRRQGSPLVHVFEQPDPFPPGVSAYLYLYDDQDFELVFWPLTIQGISATLDVSSEEWWPYRDLAREFEVTLVYPEETAKRWPWWAGPVVRLP